MARARKIELEELPEDNLIEKKDDVEVSVEKTDASTAPVPAPDEVIASLKEQLKKSNEESEANRLRAESAQKTSVELASKANTAEASAITAHEQSLSNAINSASTEVESIERRLQEAMDAGDTKGYAAASRELAAKTYKLSRLEEDKQHFDTWRETQANQPPKPTETQSPYTSTTQQWIDAHPKFTTDPVYRNIAFAAHEASKRKGIRVDTPEYFKFVEKIIDKNYAQFDEDDNASAAPAPAPKSSYASSGMPPSRDTGTNGDGQSRAVKLTAEEVDFAEANGITLQEYARQKQQLQREGRLNVNSTRR